MEGTKKAEDRKSENTQHKLSKDVLHPPNASDYGKQTRMDVGWLRGDLYNHIRINSAATRLKAF